MTEEQQRVQRHGENLFAEARRAGWKDDGEGPLEYLMRTAYETGWDDHVRSVKGTR